MYHLPIQYTNFLFIEYLKLYLRFDWYGNIAISAGWWILHGGQFGMDVTVQLVVEIVVTLVFQAGATSGALEALNVQVLVLDANEHTTSGRGG